MTEPVRVVQDMYTAFQKGDIPAVLELMAEDIDLRHNQAADLPYSGHYRGRTGAAEFFNKLGAAVQVSSFTPERYVCQGDEVVALGTWSGTARPTGKPFTARWAMYWVVKDGRAVEYTNYEDSGVTAAAFRP
jgi:ketosteroid isomerase-like protein